MPVSVLEMSRFLARMQKSEHLFQMTSHLEKKRKERKKERPT